MAKKVKQYTGCITSIEKARDFARESFVYGLKDKSEYTEFSPRAYDEVTRQMGDWFQDCLQTRTVKVRNKLKYLSLNCRDYSENPLYKMWKTCSFTTNEIVFFFFLIDYLNGKDKPVKLAEIHKEYYNMHRTDGFLRSAAQKWLQNKGCPSGIFIKDEKSQYSLAPTFDLSEMGDMLQYYSEIAPGGVVGSFILDKQEKRTSAFGYKQHYPGQAFDCEIICNALFAIKNKNEVSIDYQPKGKEEIHIQVFPLKIYSSTQNGRQYLFAWEKEQRRYFNYRIDRIKTIDITKITPPYAESVQEEFDEIKKHIWGVSLGDGETIHVEFLVKVTEDEGYIINRLDRETRCGTITPEKNCPGLIRFKADVYDAQEMFPWIRTYICRIVELKISDPEIEKLFWDSITAMYDFYLEENTKA